MRRAAGATITVLVLSAALAAQNRTALSDLTRQFVSVDAPVVALEHVRVIDGTGARTIEDQTILIENGTIRAVGPTNSLAVPPGAHVMDLSGHTVIPGLVGMHDHICYIVTSGRGRIPGAPVFYQVPVFSYPRLYLANGVTTIRTTADFEPDTDLTLKHEIDAGRVPGPKMFVSGTYLEGAGNDFAQVHTITGPEDAVRQVNFWADEGATGFKAYQHLTRAELAAIIKAAHARGFKVTSHLCSIGFREAAELGIDGFEHGLRVDTEFDPGKKPDTCPPAAETTSTLANLDLSSRPVQDMIHELVRRHVAITSTLTVWEPSTLRPVQPGVLQVLSAPALADYLLGRVRASQANADQAAQAQIIFKKEEQFEHEFAKAGGLLLAGPDPTGGGLVAGFGDQRELELLVDAGFTPLEAIHIYTQNGAQFLGIADKVGTVQAGKQADLLVVRGDPSQKISDIENVKVVFKDGVGYDSEKLLQSVQGQVGLQ
jgi:imidazolonepropionase-like amidohydrolase